MYTHGVNVAFLCQSAKSFVKPRPPLRSLPVENTIFQRWHVDHLALPKSPDGYKYVLVAVDSFSLFSVLLPAKTTNAEETAQLLYDHVFMQFGCHTLLSGRGAAFRSKLMRHLCQLIGVKQIFTSSRHPQTNSRCEVYDKKNILNSLRTTVKNKQDWPKLLASISHSFRCTVVPHLGFSPYEIDFGIKPYLSFGNLLLATQNLPKNVGQYLAQIVVRR